MMKRLTLVLFAIASSVAGNTQTKLFIADDRSFSILVPATWTTSTNGSQAFVGKDPSFPEGRWEIEFSEPNMTLEELSKKQLQNFESNKPGADKLNHANFQTINGTRWWIVDYTSKKGTRYICFQSIQNKKRFAIYYFAKVEFFRTGLKAADDLVASFSPDVNKRADAAAKPPESKPDRAVKNKPTSSGYAAGTPAGTVGADAIRLEVDMMNPFHGKYTHVRKGSAEALLNDDGKIVIPFGKHRYRDAQSYWQINISPQGQILNTGDIYPAYFGTLAPFNPYAQPNKPYGVNLSSANYNSNDMMAIDAHGKFLKIPVSGMDHEGYVTRFVWPDSKSYPMEATMVSEKYDGSKIIGSGNQRRTKATGSYESVRYKFEFTSWSAGASGYYGWTCGLRPASALPLPPNSSERESKNKRVGFINRKGQFQVAPGYFKVGEFSEGLAFVCRLNEFDEERWGAIDTTGKLVIPFQYRTQPGRLNHGRALIQAVDMDKIAYAMIDRAGKILFTIPKNSGDTVSVEPACCNPLPEKFLFSHGYTYVAVNLKSKGPDWGHFLDTNGVYTPIIRMLRKHYSNGEAIQVVSPVRDEQFLFTVATSHYSGIGIANIRGEIIIPPVFTDLRMFEPESKMQYAAIKRNKEGEKDIEGYIDRTGVFRIIRAERPAGF